MEPTGTADRQGDGPVVESDAKYPPPATDRGTTASAGDLAQRADDVRLQPVGENAGLTAIAAQQRAEAVAAGIAVLIDDRFLGAEDGPDPVETAGFVRPADPPNPVVAPGPVVVSKGEYKEGQADA